MNLITATELRTKSKELIDTLLSGRSVDIIHRSRIVGVIKPKKVEEKVFDAQRFLKLVKQINFPRLSVKERERRYRQHLERKYGKNLS